jgi:hypothetical protein
MTRTFRSTRDFAEIADLIAAESGQTSDAFANAFDNDAGGVRIGSGADGISDEMPDATHMQLATEMLVRTVFDVLRDTRMERYAERIAWGIVNSIHMTARATAGQADDAARTVKDLVRCADGSEVLSVELEAAQEACQALDQASDALACMRDFGAATFQAETGRPWSTARSTLVSSKRTASVIAATDFLAGRHARRVDQHHPQGPVVIFSSGRTWGDHRPIYAELDQMRARLPNMVLVTTAQSAGGDAIAEAWAGRTGTRLVKFDLPRGLGKRAAFVRNDQLVALQPVDALICEGSGVQEHLARVLRHAGIRPRLLALTRGAGSGQ